jgi:hypothetical protein
MCIYIYLIFVLIIWKKRNILSDLLCNEVYYDEYKNFFVSFKQNTFQKRMREKKKKTKQTSTTSRRERERNDIVCTFYKQNMTMRKRRKAPSTKR